jgi:hypothetical protein
MLFLWEYEKSTPVQIINLMAFLITNRCVFNDTSATIYINNIIYNPDTDCFLFIKKDNKICIPQNSYKCDYVRRDESTNVSEFKISHETHKDIVDFVNSTKFIACKMVDVNFPNDERHIVINIILISVIIPTAKNLNGYISIAKSLLVEWAEKVDKDNKLLKFDGLTFTESQYIYHVISIFLKFRCKEHNFEQYPIKSFEVRLNNSNTIITGATYKDSDIYKWDKIDPYYIGIGSWYAAEQLVSESFNNPLNFDWKTAHKHIDTLTKLKKFNIVIVDTGTCQYLFQDTKMFNFIYYVTINFMKDDGILLIPTHDIVVSNLVIRRKFKSNVKSMEDALLNSTNYNSQTYIRYHTIEPLIHKHCILVGTIELNDIVYNIYIKKTADKNDNNIVARLNHIKNQYQRAIQYTI